MTIRPQTSAAREAYLQGFSDRRRDKECRDNEMGALAPRYLDGWEDGERLPVISRPASMPAWLIDLLSAEERAAQ